MSSIYKKDFIFQATSYESTKVVSKRQVGQLLY